MLTFHHLSVNGAIPGIRYFGVSRNGLFESGHVIFGGPASVGVHFDGLVGGMVYVDGLLKDFLGESRGVGHTVVTLFIPAIFGVIITGGFEVPRIPLVGTVVDDLPRTHEKTVGRQPFRRFAAHLGRNAFEAEARYVGTLGG